MQLFGGVVGLWVVVLWRSFWHCYWLGAKRARRRRASEPPTAQPPRRRRSVSAPPPLRTAWRAEGYGKKGGAGCFYSLPPKSFLRKKLSGCFGTHFSACIRLTSALNLSKVGFPISALFECSQMKLCVASHIPYCKHT